MALAVLSSVFADSSFCIRSLAAAVLSTAVSLRTEKAARELGYTPIIDWERGFAGLA